jgi:hypothetical protein
VHRFKCPKCAHVIGLDDPRGGETARCPKCGTLLRLPAPKAAAAPPAPAARGTEPAPAPQPESDSLVQVQAVPPGGLTGEKPNGRADTEPDDKPLPGFKRKRRKKRRRRSKEAGGVSWLVMGDGLFLGVMAVLALWGAAMAVGGLFKPSLEVVVIIYGVILGLVGLSWLYMTALSEGMELLPQPEMTGRGLMMTMVAGVWMLVTLLVVVVTAAIFLVTNPGQGWKPAVVGLLGVVFTVAGAVLLYQLHPGLTGGAG